MTNYLTRGNAKEEGKEQTPTPTHRANPESAREKKKRTDDGPNPDQRRGADGSLTQPARRGPHEIRESIIDVPKRPASSAQFVIRLRGTA